jgi:hypothetical protein
MSTQARETIALFGAGFLAMFWVLGGAENLGHSFSLMVWGGF